MQDLQKSVPHSYDDTLAHARDRSVGMTHKVCKVLKLYMDKLYLSKREIPNLIDLFN